MKEKMTAMEYVRQLLKKVPYPKEPPVIDGEYGRTTESARRQAAINIASDPAVRVRVEDAMIKKYNGDVVAAFMELKRRYPEAYP